MIFHATNVLLPKEQILSHYYEVVVPGYRSCPDLSSGYDYWISNYSSPELSHSDSLGLVGRRGNRSYPDPVWVTCLVGQVYKSPQRDDLHTFRITRKKGMRMEQQGQYTNLSLSIDTSSGSGSFRGLRGSGK
jgi:hypothetical protein